MIGYIIVGIICFLVGGAIGISTSDDEPMFKDNNNQPQINIIIDGKSIEEYFKRKVNENE